MKAHLDLAKEYWSRLVRQGDVVIDATCGNGHDTLFLAKLGAKVTGMDIQSDAIETTKKLLDSHGHSSVELFLGCHSSFPDRITPGSVRLVVYNLGYLPGGDKQKTTQTETTLASVAAAMKLLMPGGAVSITCYPGHPEGSVEEDALLAFAAALLPQEWSCCHHRWLNRLNSPSLLILQKGQRT